jgi:hypothetical protein
LAAGPKPCARYPTPTFVFSTPVTSPLESHGGETAPAIGESVGGRYLTVMLQWVGKRDCGRRLLGGRPEEMELTVIFDKVALGTLSAHGCLRVGCHCQFTTLALRA